MRLGELSIYQPQLLDFSYDAVGLAVGAEHIENSPLHLDAPLPNVLVGVHPRYGVGVDKNLEAPMHASAP